MGRAYGHDSARSDCQAQEHFARGAHQIVEVFEQFLFGVDRFILPDAQTVIAGGDDRLGRDVVQLVAGELLGDELVVRFVVVQGANHVVAITPYKGLGPVAFITVGLGVANQIEPMPAPAFAVVRRLEQVIDHALERPGRTIGQKRFDFLGRRGQADQVVVGATQYRMSRGRGGRLQACLL